MLKYSRRLPVTSTLAREAALGAHRMAIGLLTQLADKARDKTVTEKRAPASESRR